MLAILIDEQMRQKLGILHLHYTLLRIIEVPAHLAHYGLRRCSVQTGLHL